MSTGPVAMSVNKIIRPEEQVLDRFFSELSASVLTLNTAQELQVVCC